MRTRGIEKIHGRTFLVELENDRHERVKDIKEETGKERGVGSDSSSVRSIMRRTSCIAACVTCFLVASVV